MIEIKHLKYIRGHKTILSDVSFKFEEGKTYGIIGPNGAGKSTLLRHLMKLIEPPKATIFLNKKDIHTYSIKEYAEQMSFVFQENTRQVDFSVYEILLMGKYTKMDLWGNLNSEHEEEVQEILEELNIVHLKEQPINTLSGGEAQKVFIGRALLQNTPILLLDEPTSMLDMHNSIELMECIQRLKKKRNLTVIMVLHDLNLALHFSEEILLMEEGKLVAVGTPQALLEGKELSRVYHDKLNVIYEEGKAYIVPSI